MTVVSNPYSGFQRLCGEMCCWACYRVLMTAIDCARHTCDACHRQGYVAAPEGERKQRAAVSAP
jgi:hypothetical protein